MIKKLGFNRTTADYLLMLLLITTSGNPLYTNSLSIVGLLLVFIIALYMFVDRKKTFSKNIILFFTLVLIITMSQVLIFSFFSFNNALGLFIRIATAYLVLKALDKRFIEYYIDVMFIIALMSMSFYVISIINVNILLPFSVGLSDPGNINSAYSFLGLYTFMSTEVHRNAGFFWEPGAFAGYMLIAYMFNFYFTDKERKKRGLVFLVAIISSVSTTAYLALFAFLFFAYYKKVKNLVVRTVVIVSIFGGGYFAYYNLDFLGEKINQQLAIAQNVHSHREDTNTQRFLNILRDMEDLKGHELFGRGTHPTTRYSYDPENQIRTVGLTDLLVKFGFPFFLLALYFLFRSICVYLSSIGQYGYSKCISIFVGIMFTLMSEVYFNYPLYWSLLFLHLIYNRPEDESDELERNREDVIHRNTSI